ncbi:MAG: LCP family protein [Clostridia bacterium]|nr:LCP family protein [Clostridia bacterium]
MNDQFHTSDETGILIDELKQLLDEQQPADPFRQAGDLPTGLPDPVEPPEDAYELDIHFEDEALPDALPEKKSRSVKAYNSDYVTKGTPKTVQEKPAGQEQPVYQVPVQQTYQPPVRQARRTNPPKRRTPMREEAVNVPKKKKHTGAIILIALVLVLALTFFAGILLYPKRPDATKMKKGDVATILIAGTDKDGTRTDTIMLLYIDRDAEEINLLSLPRDLLTYVDGNPMKLNAVYGYGGCGEKGMELLMDEMVDRIGFRPDGYVLFDFDAVEELIDRMGGITFDVPCEMDYEDPAQSLSIHLKEGKQRLNGEEALWVLRYRSGYALADLKRVEVQRDLIKAALEQWVSLRKLPRGASALFSLKDGTTTDLSTRNFAWAAKAVRSIGLSGMQTATLPGEWRSPYYYPFAQDGADLLNRYFNPTTRTITEEDVGY